MKRIFIFLLLALSAFAADLTVDNKALQVDFSLTGGGITSLVRKKTNAQLTFPGYTSLTERIFGVDDGSKIFETMRDLRYRVVKMESSASKYTVILSCKGVTCFDWLRVTKTIVFPANKENFTVTYTLSNLDDKPHAAGIWLESFFALYDETGSANLILQPRNGEFYELTHPGNATSDEWSGNPGLSVMAIGGKVSNQGMVISLPSDVCAGFYNWCSSRKGSVVNTTEMMTRELDIAPKSEVSFKVNYVISDNAPALARTLAKKPEYKIGEKRQGRDACVFPGTPAHREEKGKRTGVFAESQKFMDFQIPRQFNESIRSVILPADADPKRVAVYEVRNKRIEIDRPLPVNVKLLPNGSWRLLFKMPALGGHGYYDTIFKNGLAFDKKDARGTLQCLGEVFMTCRVVLDAEPESAPKLDAEEPELVYNGSFEAPNQKNTFAAGYDWHAMTLYRKLHFWEKGAGRDGSYGIRLKQEKLGSAPNFFIYFIAEQNVKYTFNAWIKCENPDKQFAIVTMTPVDAKGKSMTESSATIEKGKNSYPWRKVTKTFHLPKGAVVFDMLFQLARAAKEGTMWVDDVSLVPEDYLFTPKPMVETTRDAAILDGYAPLAQLEVIDHGYETVHEKWFKPAAWQMPDLLYLCSIVRTNEDASRRQIVELCQRAELKYEFIPLLPKLHGIQAEYSFGVGDPNFDTYLEPYSIERIKALKKLPKIALVQGINFANMDSNHALEKVLAEMQSKGTSLVFLNCARVPESITGKALKTVPPEWMLIPKLNKHASVSSHMKAFEKCFWFNLSDASYYRLNNFPSVPTEMRDQWSPAIFSRDFPFWEYSFLPLLKGIREKAGVKPDAIFVGAEYKDGSINFKLKAEKAVNGKLELEYKTMFRSTDATANQAVSLVAGDNAVAVAVPELPGGRHILHYKLMTSDAKVLDAGALNFDTAVNSPIKLEYASKDRIYATGKPVDISVAVENSQAGDVIELALEDSEFRVVAKDSKPAASKVAFSMNIPAPYTILYRVFARLVRNGKVQTQLMGEISLPDRKLDPQDYHAGMWGGRLILSKMLRDLGFDLLSCSGNQENVRNGIFRNQLNLGFYPLVLSYGHVADKSGRTYRNDVATDPVRNPCYNDPEFTKRAEVIINKNQRQNEMRYYAGYYNELGDEMFLGSTVCYSEHCLREFRKYLKEQYGTIEKLNQEWGTKYASFDEATPVQKEPVHATDNLSQWLDHKMFMSGVYAHQYVGKREESIRKEVPGAQVGLSGTQIPGYGYDWAQMMKHNTCLSYYNGVQTTLVNDFALPGTLLGQWGGGYVTNAKVFEIYECTSQWYNLFKGANASWNWHGTAYNGDGSPTENLKIYCREFNLFKRGLARLLLTADKDIRPVAVLYSHASMFTAMNGGIGQADWQNTQTGWDEMLRDLKISFKFVSYEELASPEFPSLGYKVVILPMALALSDAERNNLVKIAENGGTIIADVAPGRYDAHGKRVYNTVLDKLFPANPGRIIPISVNVSQPPMVARFRVEDPKLGYLTEKACGKGRGVLINAMMNSYQALTMSGVGGELATASSGTQAFCLSMQKAVMDQLLKAGVKPFAEVKDAKGNTFPSQAVLRRAGENYYFGIIPQDNQPRSHLMIDHKNAPEVTVKLPVKGIIYDLRKSEKIAEGDTFKIKSPVGYGQLFAILPKAAKEPSVKMPSKVKAGDVVTCDIKTKGAVSKTVYRLEVTLPDGTSPAIYAQNATFPTPEGKLSFQVPFNAQKGDWTATIVHVPSGKRSAKKFTVQ